jgi:hypothetical protein
MGEGAIVRSTYGNKELRLEAQMISLHSEKILSHDMTFEVMEPITASDCIDNGVLLLSYGSSPAVYKVKLPKDLYTHHSLIIIRMLGVVPSKKRPQFGSRLS